MWTSQLFGTITKKLFSPVLIPLPLSHTLLLWIKTNIYPTCTLATVCNASSFTFLMCFLYRFICFHPETRKINLLARLVKLFDCKVIYNIHASFQGSIYVFVLAKTNVVSSFSNGVLKKSSYCKDTELLHHSCITSFRYLSITCIGINQRLRTLLIKIQKDHHGSRTIKHRWANVSNTYIIWLVLTDFERVSIDRPT